MKGSSRITGGGGLTDGTLDVLDRHQARRLAVAYAVPIVLSIALAGGSVTRLLPFDWLEAFGFISGAWGVWMQVRENVWNWPVQLVSSALYVVVFLHARLFSDAGLNVVYVVLYMLGWYWWLRGGASHGPLVIHRITLRQTTALAAITVAATVVETVFLTAIHDSAPFMDALTTVLSLVALYLTARKVFESWHLWVLTNLLYIGLYVYKQLDLTALLYAIFAALSVAGLINWRRLLAEQRLHTAGTGPVTAAGAGSWSNRV